MTEFCIESPSDLGHNHPIMKSSLLALLLVLTGVSADLLAQNKIELQPNDTILSVLQRSSGQVIELRLKSGGKLAYLSQLTGAEYYEAVVDLADISAVVVRTKK